MADKIIRAIQSEIGGKDPSKQPASKKTISSIYEDLQNNQTNFLGYLMNLSYKEATVITNDYFKMAVGGISKNSFLLIFPQRIEQKDLSVKLPPHLVLARVLEPAATPLATDVSRTYFEMHKNQMPEIDVFTKSELQWSAMKVSILGTYYDDPSSGEISFGGDLESFLSPHMYSVFMPTDDVLQLLVNSFVNKEHALRLGVVRFTETAMVPKENNVQVLVSPHDFIGSRSAFFGKTRMGKSNTVKKVVQMILESDRKVGQVIFDLNGEYAYKNEQDDTCIYDLYSEKCVRYSLRDRQEADVKILKANFYTDLALGHQIIKGVYDQISSSKGAYENAFLEWDILEKEEEEILKREDRGNYERYLRNIAIYKCLLKKLGFATDAPISVDLKIKKELLEMAQEKNEGLDISKAKYPLDEALNLYSIIWKQYVTTHKQIEKAVDTQKNEEETGEKKKGKGKIKNPYISDRGTEYFDDVAKSLLTLITNLKETNTAVAGASKLIPLKKYHDARGGELISSILDALEDGKCVILDLSNAPEELAKFFSERVSAEVFKHQMNKFTENKLGEHFVQFFFEEAHNLFPSSDKDLKNIYNRLAKEGAKLQIGVGYSTQSISSLSPDLLKNTENFFIAHLNDDREIRELTRYYEFQDVGHDVQRSKTRGLVRLITRSHKFAIPVQIDKFEK